MLPHPLNAALYHAGDIGRARAAARVLRIFQDSSSRKPDDEIMHPPTRRSNFVDRDVLAFRLNSHTARIQNSFRFAEFFN